ncbi:hypothetical protein YT03_004503 [Salmonella enterica subsp. enterica]|nr:hypothetical protein [Salmonella enterica subsp. enterica serovar Sandiego]
MNKKIERGLSLIEAAMVLALSAVVAGVLYYYAAAAASNDNQKTIELIETIVSKVNALYANPGHNISASVHHSIPRRERGMLNFRHTTTFPSL